MSDWRKQTKARKTHQCEICRNQILPGEVYVRYDCTPWGHPDNEGYHTYRNCRFCDHMHYDVLQIADEDGVPWWEETVQAIRAHFFEQVRDVCGPEIDLETYADDFSRWTLAGGPFERCVGHPDCHFESILPGLLRCPKCATACDPSETIKGCHHPRSFYIASEWNAAQRFFRQYPRYLPEPISYEVALDLLRDRGISLNSPGRVEQILGWFGDTDNVRRAIETVRGGAGMNITQKAKALMDLLPGGPWMWGGHSNDVRLSTVRGGQQYLMGTARKGFSGAQFAFQVFRTINKVDPWKNSGILHYGKDLYVSRAAHDKATIKDIDHPLAQIIKLIPELVDALVSSEAEVERLRWKEGLTETPAPKCDPKCDAALGYHEAVLARSKGEC